MFGWLLHLEGTVLNLFLLDLLLAGPHFTATAIEARSFPVQSGLEAGRRSVDCVQSTTVPSRGEGRLRRSIASDVVSDLLQCSCTQETFCFKSKSTRRR